MTSEGESCKKCEISKRAWMKSKMKSENTENIKLLSFDVRVDEKG